MRLVLEHRGWYHPTLTKPAETIPPQENVGKESFRDGGRQAEIKRLKTENKRWREDVATSRGHDLFLG